MACTFSSRGPTCIDHPARPDLLAPGNKIVSVRSPGCKLASDYPGNEFDASSYSGASSGKYYYLLPAPAWRRRTWPARSR